jgi:ribosome biogenesis protein BRX1
MNLIKIFAGSFGGRTLYENPKYQTPNAYRRSIKLMMAMKYKQKVKSRMKSAKEMKKTLKNLPKNPMDVVFDTKNYK